MSMIIDGSNGATFPTGRVQPDASNPYVMKNRIINGAMGIWQRGTSGFTTSGNYAADRFFIGTLTSLSAVAQSSDVPSGYKYSISINGTNYPNLSQRIESVNCTDLVGQSVTISFWAKTNTSTNTLSVYIDTPNTLIATFTPTDGNILNLTLYDIIAN